MLARLGRVVPPARVPQALKARRWMLCDEVDIPPQGLFQEPQNAVVRARVGQRGDGLAEVTGEVEHQRALGLRFEELQLAKELLDPLVVALEVFRPLAGFGLAGGCEE